MLMVEINFAREILAIVRAFLILGMRTQPIYRIILSRLYYAAHHVGRALLKSVRFAHRRLRLTVGLTPEQWRDNVHNHVIDELERRFVDTGNMNPNALEALVLLRRLRVRADYILSIRIRERNINRALNLFEIYFNECCSILGVS
jgi:uncharacterized protein (UPF0332 family)